MVTHSTQTPLSADINLLLHVNGQALPLTHTGGEFVILKDAIPLTPGPAVVEVIIDGRSFQSPTQLLFADPSTGRVILSAMNLTPTLTPSDAPTDTPTDTPLIVANDLPDRVTA